VDIEVVADSRIEHGDAVRLTVVDEGDMPKETTIEDGIDRLSVVPCFSRVAPNSDPVWDLCLPRLDGFVVSTLGFVV
jgi:hypothetical protein